uniref:Golgin subfamily A member 6-like protein 7 n=1 Tax=Diabrotica virgifera virgifera TaxID=50390 RepID=A0A6P7GLW0_DIAVI
MNPDDYTSDDNRKRYRENEEQSFSKSKKVSRTPDKRNTEEDKLDQILNMMANLTKETQDLKIHVKEIKEEQRQYREKMRELRIELEELRQENGEVRRENEHMKKELEDVKVRLERIDRARKENNVIVQGMTIDTGDRRLLKETMENFMKKELDINIKIEEAVKLGNKTCLVRLPNKEEKIKELQIQKEIAKIANDEIKKGKRVKIKHNKSIIDGRERKWNKNKNHLDEVFQNVSKN